VHAPIYAQASGWPLNAYLDRSLASLQDNVDLYDEVLETQRVRGLRIPPSA